MKQSSVLSELKEMTRANIAQVKEFQSSEIERLEKSATLESWNVLQCIEHLNRYSLFYLSEFQQKIEQGKKITGSLEFHQGFWGKKFTVGMLPSEGMKTMKTFASKNPEKQNLNLAVLNQFISDQQHFLDLLDQASKLDLNKNDCSITLPLLKMRLGDTLRFYVYHNVRHIHQAIKASKS